MALGALQRRVRARQREAGSRMIERTAAPVRRGVALIAGRREARLRVIWSRGALIILEMALGAGSAAQAVIVIDMALRTCQRSMESS